MRKVEKIKKSVTIIHHNDESPALLTKIIKSEKGNLYHVITELKDCDDSLHKTMKSIEIINEYGLSGNDLPNSHSEFVLTEDVVKSKPNNYDLGEFIRKKFFEKIRHIFFIGILFLILTSFSFKSTPPMRVLFVGDSLTCNDYGWQYQVAKHCGNSYTNVSVGGKRLEWMKHRLDQQLKTDSLYSKVFIYGGCNDAFCYVDLKQSLKLTQMMVDTCNRRGIQPIVVLGFDPAKVTTKSVYDDATTRRCVARYVDLQKMMANELKNCKIIPVDSTIKYSDTWDGIHMSNTGHKKLAQWIINHLN
jgi:lysophospholipase L1-like esterase